jgi:hypothetical protein
MFDIYQRAKLEAGYNATIFLRMISDRGGLATAKYLINSPTPSDGYTHLYERGRLDLSFDRSCISLTSSESLSKNAPCSLRARSLLGAPRRFPGQRQVYTGARPAGPPLEAVTAVLVHQGSMQRVLVLSVSVAVITWAASGCGVAQPIQLNGTFQLSGSSTCINGEPDLPFKLKNVCALESFAVQGVATFNSDGTGTESGWSMGVEFNPSSSLGLARTLSFIFSFTYFVGADLVLDVEPSSPVTGTVAYGPPGPMDFTITEFPGVFGFVSQNRNTLTAATQKPQMETITYSNGDTVKRICSRSRVYTLCGDWSGGPCGTGLR